MPNTELQDAFTAEGLLSVAAGDNVVRLVPPLVISDADMDEAVEMIRRGVLGQSFVISAAHTDADLDCTIEAAHRALAVYARAIEAGTVDGLLRGRPVAPALREFAAPRNVTTTRR